MMDKYAVTIRCNDHRISDIVIDNLEMYDKILEILGCTENTTLSRYEILHNILYHINPYVVDFIIGDFEIRVQLLKYNETRRVFEVIRADQSKYYVYRRLDYISIGKYTDYPSGSKDESYKLEEFSFNKLFK